MGFALISKEPVCRMDKIRICVIKTILRDNSLLQEWIMSGR